MKPYNIPMALYSLRTSRKMTQSELAQKAKVGQDYISRIEKQQKIPTIETLERILEALGIGFSDFFRIAEKLCDPEVDKKIAEIVKSRSKLRKEVLAEVMESLE